MPATSLESQTRLLLEEEPGTWVPSEPEVVRAWEELPPRRFLSVVFSDWSSIPKSTAKVRSSTHGQESSKSTR